MFRALFGPGRGMTSVSIGAVHTTTGLYRICSSRRTAPPPERQTYIVDALVAFWIGFAATCVV